MIYGHWELGIAHGVRSEEMKKAEGAEEAPGAEEAINFKLFNIPCLKSLKSLKNSLLLVSPSPCPPIPLPPLAPLSS